MIKKFQFERLEEDSPWYGTILKADGRTIHQPYICIDFVKLILGGLPKEIQIEVSDDPIERENVVKIAVYKNGYYRWSWRCLDRQCFLHGMRRVIEDILIGMFPKEGNDNRGGEHTLWLVIK